jgi:hypothetical protein
MSEELIPKVAWIVWGIVGVAYAAVCVWVVVPGKSATHQLLAPWESWGDFLGGEELIGLQRVA